MTLQEQFNLIDLLFPSNKPGGIDASSIRSALKSIITQARQDPYRGEWQPDTAYSASETLSNGGNQYRVKADHRSGAVFNGDLYDKTVQGGQPTNGSVTTEKLSSNAVTLDKLAAVLANRLEALLAEEQPGRLCIPDEAGNMLFLADANGVQYVGQVTQSQVAALSYILHDDQPGAFEISDPEGNLQFKADANGVRYVGQVPVAEFTALKNTVSSTIGSILDLFPGEFITCDDEGYISDRISASGVRVSTLSVGGSNAKPVMTGGTFLADYVQLINLGQSLSVSGSFASGIDFYDTKTFAGGILTNYDPDVAGAADTYFGAGLIAVPTTGTETQGKALAKILKELIRDENGVAMADQGYTPVVNSCGTGGASWSQLSNTSGKEYRRLLESVRRGKDFAVAQGKSYNVPVLSYIQGENSLDKSDSVDTFYNKLNTLFTNLNTDIKGITGQANDVQFIVYQIASFSNNPPATVNVPLAQLKISLEKANVHFGCAMYQMEYSDALHGTSNTYRIMGAMMGVVAKRAIVDGVKMLPIKPISWSTQVNSTGTSWVLSLKMNVPVKPLVLDSSVNALYTTVPANYGFSILNGSTEIITGVSVSRGDTINIVCNQNPIGKELTYAIGGRASGGNLRDSQGNTIKINCEGVPKRVDNWCPIFKQVL